MIRKVTCRIKWWLAQYSDLPHEVTCLIKWYSRRNFIYEARLSSQAWCVNVDSYRYVVATSSRLLKMMRSFAEHSLFYRALLQKRRIISRSLLIVATPYDFLRQVSWVDFWMSLERQKNHSSYVTHDSSICETWLIKSCLLLPDVKFTDSSICETWLIKS